VSDPRLHVVALSHLDTQWRWTVRDTVERFLPATVDDNERLFARYPRYVLSFEGAWRYRLLAEHDPARFEIVRRRVREGRWFPAGAALEAFDAILPSPESLGRQILYGRAWMRRELGAESRDLFLPDCFGFPRTLPTVAAHFDIVGFTTQKLRRGPLLRSAFGIPFAIGRWRAAGGAEILAALDPGEYSASLPEDLSHDAVWQERFGRLAESGLPLRLLTFTGIGDRGGAPPEASIATLETALDADGPIEVRHGPSQKLFDELATDGERDRLPSYEGELLMRLHATGCYTAKAVLKRWNREVERLARLAEASVALATWAGTPAPLRRIEEAWSLLLAHQMHDDLTGTSIPAAYAFSLADLGAAANLFREITLDAVSALAPPAVGDEATVAVLSPLALPRDELVELDPVGEHDSEAVDEAGAARIVQRVERPGEPTRLLFPAAVGGVGLTAFRLRRARSGSTNAAVEVSDRHLENARYRVELDTAGAIASIVDRRLDRQLLDAPPRLELLPDRSAKYPAWEILWSDASAPPLAEVDRLASCEVVERGPLRAAIRVERSVAGCRVVETWSLASCGPELLIADIELDWRLRGRLLKASWQLAAEDDGAFYDDGLSAVRRPVASEALYEVPSHGWAAIADRRHGFGVALLADGRYGWDQPDASTLRSTWIHAPRASWKFRHQATQDFGRHRFRFAVAGFATAELHDGSLAALGDRFAHPPVAFAVEPGVARSTDQRPPQVRLALPGRLLALKPSEDGAGIVARSTVAGSEPAVCEPEIDGAPGWSACDGLEQLVSIGRASPLAPGALRSLRASPPSEADHRGAPLSTIRGEPIDLAFDRVAFTRNGIAGADGFDDRGTTFPVELLPALETAVAFDLSAARAGAPSCFAARGQNLELPFAAAELWLLAASVHGELRIRCRADDRPMELLVPDWRRALLGSTPGWSARHAGDRADGGFLRRPLALRFGHLHDRRGRDLAVEVGMLFALRLAVDGARSVRLPDAPGLRVVAATATRVPARRIRELDAYRSR